MHLKLHQPNQNKLQCGSMQVVGNTCRDFFLVFLIVKWLTHNIRIVECIKRSTKSNIYLSCHYHKAFLRYRAVTFDKYAGSAPLTNAKEISKLHRSNAPYLVKREFKWFLLDTLVYFPHNNMNDDWLPVVDEIPMTLTTTGTIMMMTTAMMIMMNCLLIFTDFFLKFEL